MCCSVKRGFSVAGRKLTFDTDLSMDTIAVIKEHNAKQAGEESRADLEAMVG